MLLEGDRVTIETKNQHLSLSDAVARDAPLPMKGDYILWDTKTTNFGLRIQSGGSKTWIVQKKLGTRPCRVVLGVFSKNGAQSTVGYMQSRARVSEIITMISKGIDPNLTKRRLIANTVSEREKEAYTVVACFKDYIEDYTEAKKLRLSQRTLDDMNRTLKRLEASNLKSIPLMDLTGADLAKYLDEATKKATSFRATRGGKTVAGGDMRYLRAAVRLAMTTKTDCAPLHDPIVQLNAKRKGWAVVTPRTRIVGATEGELKRWWSAVDAVRQKAKIDTRKAMADYLQLALLWGGRRTETLSLKWEYVSLEDDVICIPGSQTKNSKDHIFPITQHAKTLLENRWRANQERDEASEWVFPSRRKDKNGKTRPMSEPGTAIRDVKKLAGCDFSSHDLRRTFGTLLQETGVSDFSVKRALNHVSQDVTGKHYLVSRVQKLRVLYQNFEDVLLIEAGVITAPTKLELSAEDFAEFKAWKEGRERGAE